MTISFNVSVAGDKSFLSTYEYPMQIMPQQRKTITSQMLSQYPNISKKRIACVHTSYVTRAFSEKILDNGFQRLNILNYLALADRIGFQYILVHGPESMKEWNILYACLNILHGLEQKSGTDVKVIIEMPAFKGSFIDDLKERMAEDKSYEKSDIKDIKILDYLSYYFDHIIEQGFDIVLDTAHLYSNGASVEDMIALFKRYEKNMKISHLNGNKNRQFTSDAHCPIFSDKNRIERVNVLMDYLSTTKLILITENASEGTEYKEWKRFADKYKLSIIPDHPNLNC